MNTFIPTRLIGVLALLFSSMAMAATVTVVPSTATPDIGNQFTVTLQATDFVNVGGGTWTVSWDNSKATFVSAVLPATGPVSATSGSFLVVNPDTGPTGPKKMDLLPGTPPVNGAFDFAVLTFNAVAGGDLNLLVFENAIDFDGWFDNDTAEQIPTDYTQASVTIVAPPAPEITVTDSVAPNDDLDIPFGNVNVGNPSSQTVTIMNDGNLDLVLGTLTDPGAPFALANDLCSGQTLTQGTDCTVDVVFTPAVTGPANSTFDIPSNDADEAVVTVSVDGIGTVPTPDITVTDSVAPANDLTVPFGNVQEGQTSSETVTVTNDGDADLTIGTLTNPAADFALENDNCSNVVLAPASSCTVGVVFAPAATGGQSSSFEIPSDDPDENPVTVAVTGTGTPIPAPDISVTDSVAPANDLSVPFGNVTVGQTGTATVTVANAGDANLVIGTIASANPLAAPFSIANDNCSGQTVAPAANCTFQVQFQPTAEVTSNDGFDIPSNDPDEDPVTVSVSGTGTPVAVPDIVVTDSVAPANDLSVPFGTINQGATDTQTVTVTNNGTANLVIGTIASANPLAAPFSKTNDNCSGQTVAPTANCTFQVRFQPTAAGAANDALDIPSNDPDTASVTLNVSGTGGAGSPEITVTDSIAPNNDLLLPLGNVRPGQTGTQTVTVRNDGAANLVIGTIGGLAAPFSLGTDNCSGQSLAPAGTCTVQVRFQPDAAGDFSDGLDIPSNDADEATVTVSVTGTGIRLKNGSSALDPWSLALLAGILLARRRIGAD